MNQRTKEILEQMKKQRALDKLRKQQKQYAIDGKINTAKNVANNLPKAINYGQKAVDTLKTFKAPAASPTALTNSIKAATSANGLTSGLGSASAISDATKAATSVGNTASNLASTGSAISDATKAATAVGNAGSTASSAAGALQGVGKAMPVVGAALGGLSAANNFSKGNHVDGALDLAKTGAMFIPGVGWAVAGAIQVGQMIKNAINKKKQKNLQKNMQRMAENEQIANEKKQEAIESFGDNSLAVNTMPEQSMLGGSTSPANTLDGQILPTEETTSLPEAPVSFEELGQPTGGAAGLGDISAILDEQDNANLGLSIPDALSMATSMGYGKPDVDSMLQGLNGGDPRKAALIDAANINTPQTQDEIFSAKMGDFNTVEPQAPLETEVTPNDPTTAYNQPSVADYAKQEISGQPVEDDSIANLVNKYTGGEQITPQEPQSKKDALIAEMMGKFKGGVNNFIQGFNDNASTSFSEGDLAKGLTGAAASAEPKTFMNRLGEAVGTGSRMIANPGLQGLVAGAIKGANTGDWGTGLEYGVNWAANKAKSDNYYKRLHPDAKRNPILSNYDADDFKAYADYEYKTAKTDLQAPTAAWYYKQERDAGRLSNDEYQKIINAPGYDPDARINLKQQQVNTKAENDANRINVYDKDVNSRITDREANQKLKAEQIKILSQKLGITAQEAAARINKYNAEAAFMNKYLGNYNGLGGTGIYIPSSSDESVADEIIETKYGPATRAQLEELRRIKLGGR